MVSANKGCRACPVSTSREKTNCLHRKLNKNMKLIGCLLERWNMGGIQDKTTRDTSGRFQTRRIATINRRPFLQATPKHNTVAPNCHIVAKGNMKK